MTYSVSLLFVFWLDRFKSIGAAQFKNPRQPVFALDHDVQNKTEKVNFFDSKKMRECMP